MKLIVREYLSLLKESKELDKLIPNLLFSMDITPISHAQIGVRQYGVDVAAVSSNSSVARTLYLFTIKQGDIGRCDWDGSIQSVRPSLDEIIDVYIENHIPDEYKSLPIKIVLSTGGVMKQEVLQNWSSYCKKNTTNNISFEFWGGEDLATKISTYMFNEWVLPTEFQSNMRRTLSMLGDSDYDMNDFSYILKELLLNVDKKLNNKSIKKRLFTVHMCFNIVFSWSRHENNLKPAMFAAEAMVLYVWKFMQLYNLLENKTIQGIYNEMLISMKCVYEEYYIKVKPYCSIEESLSANEREYILNCLNVFDVLKYLSMYGLMLDYEDGDSDLVSQSVKELIINHHALCSPCYDQHISDITLAIMLLKKNNEIEMINWWIFQIVEHINFAYVKLGKYFPIQSDSFDDLVALNISDRVQKEELIELSTLIPILAQWCILLEFNDIYDHIRYSVDKFFSKCSLQIWYPDDSTDEFLYTSNAAYKSGAVDAPIKLKESTSEMKALIKLVQSNTVLPEKISALKHNKDVLPLISSIHFKTPILPFYWQNNLLDILNSK